MRKDVRFIADVQAGAAGRRCTFTTRLAEADNPTVSRKRKSDRLAEALESLEKKLGFF